MPANGSCPDTKSASQPSLGSPSIPYDEFKKLVAQEIKVDQYERDLAAMKASVEAKDKEIVELQKAKDKEIAELKKQLKAKEAADPFAQFRGMAFSILRDKLTASITAEYPQPVSSPLPEAYYDKIQDSEQSKIACILVDALVNSANKIEAQLFVEARVPKELVEQGRSSSWNSCRCEMSFACGTPSSGKYLKFVVDGFSVEVFGAQR